MFVFVVERCHRTIQHLDARSWHRLDGLAPGFTPGGWGDALFDEATRLVQYPSELTDVFWCDLFAGAEGLREGAELVLEGGSVVMTLVLR
ncbi:hypothetical protein CK500_16565 [Halorubrum salipaludis]|uniref:Uncharacterized protein n=1 Tax=Halorubrum salipaludis TaxID=2032630 RepID=A0A2A2EZ66_9EURY|nr:hypothetical protein CK500_16565 [Halorubrum salipaludis]